MRLKIYLRIKSLWKHHGEKDDILKAADLISNEYRSKITAGNDLSIKKYFSS